MDLAPEGSIFKAIIDIKGHRIMMTDSFIEHDHTFTPSTSFFITCENEVEIDKLAELLSKDGKFLMPLDDYGFSQKFAWVEDQFGISWQLNLD